MASASGIPGINLIGMAGGNLGISVSVRHLVRLLRDRGCPVAILNRKAGMGRDGHDDQWRELYVDSAEALPHPINLFVEAVLWSGRTFLNPLPGLLRPTRMNVLLPWWELPDLPPRSIEASRLFDALLCPSSFIEQVFARLVPEPARIPLVQPLYLPEGGQPADRARFGLPREAVLFVSSCEPSSGRQRKNPEGLVQAFQAAFPDRTNHGQALVLKINNADKALDPAGRALLDALQARAAEDPRIRILTATLDYPALLSLYASCDVFVSLHRAEGLGLAPLEAMRLGRCVLATAWSGNLAYMDHDNACLVGYRLIPCRGDAIYAPENLGIASTWAEPDEAQAVAWMRALAADPELRASKGARARIAAERHQTEAEAADFLPSLAALWWERQQFSRPPRYIDLTALRQAEQAESRRRASPALPARKHPALSRWWDRYIGWRLRNRA